MLKGQLAPIDFSDDQGATILKSYLGDEPAMDLVKHAQVAVHPNDLPDSAFALILVDEGKALRKFACADIASTLLSTIYFCATCGQLPEYLQKVAATNLKAACEAFNIEPPDFFADLTDYDLVHSNMVDVSRMDLSPKAQMEKRAYAIPTRGMMDISDPESLQNTIDDFPKLAEKLTVTERRDAAVEILYKSRAWDVSPTDFIQKCASVNYATQQEIDSAFASRISHLDNGADDNDKHIGALKGLLEKRASLNPEVFAETLGEIDKLAGINYYYGSIPDNFLSTFGLVKESSYSWTYSNIRVSGDELESLAENPGVLKGHFMEEVVDAFSNDPIAVFESMPLAQKIVIAKVAHDYVGSSVPV